MTQRIADHIDTFMTRLVAAVLGLRSGAALLIAAPLTLWLVEAEDFRNAGHPPVLLWTSVAVGVIVNALSIQFSFLTKVSTLDD